MGGRFKKSNLKLNLARSSRQFNMMLAVQSPTVLFANLPDVLKSLFLLCKILEAHFCFLWLSKSHKAFDVWIILTKKWVRDYDCVFISLSGQDCCCCFNLVNVRSSWDGLSNPPPVRTSSSSSSSTPLTPPPVCMHEDQKLWTFFPSSQDLILPSFLPVAISRSSLGILWRIHTHCKYAHVEIAAPVYVS